LLKQGRPALGCLPKIPRCASSSNNMRIAPELIDPDADKVVRRLARHGHKAYLVGGCVRDLLLGRTPKDFDVATSATPNEIKQLFRNCRIIGRRFRLAHIFFSGGKIIETSTFRANPKQDDDDELLIRRDNVFGTVTEDALRRDFRINGLFYDVEAEDVIDHVGGLEDLERQVVSTIGEPDIRFREDPVRMLRAIKFAARLDFEIEANTWGAILRHRGEITKSAQPRVLEELYRLLRSGAAVRSTKLLVSTGIAAMLSPQLASMFDDSGDGLGEEEAWQATWSDQAVQTSDDKLPAPPVSRFEADRLYAGRDSAGQDSAATTIVQKRRQRAWGILQKLDLLVAEGASPSNAFLISVICAPFVIEDVLDPGMRPIEATEHIQQILGPLTEQLRIARRDGERALQILLSQRRLAPSRKRRGKPMALVRRDYFNDALTLYEVAGNNAGRDISEASYWRKLQSEEVGETTGEEARPRKRRRRRRGGRRKRRTPESETAPETAIDA